MKTTLAWGIKTATAPMVRRFEGALADPATAQSTIRNRIFDQASKTTYGRHYKLSDRSDFRNRLPIADYDGIRSWVDQQRANERQDLCSEKVLFYEKTSGSTGPAKYIPYTKSLRWSFTRMFLLWTHDLVRGIPGLGQGRFYFSVSPKLGAAETTDQGKPIGLDDDAEYLGPMKWLMKPFFIDTRAAAAKRDAEEFKFEACKALVAADDLEAISVWNPSFLTVLLDVLSTRREELAAFSGNRRDAFAHNEIDFMKLWPQLKLISCWADANAAPLASALAERFPAVILQGKGLLATEAPMTIPRIGVQGGVPLIEDVYFEFEMADGSVRELHELKEGDRAKILISQLGGLLRYRMGDEVEVVSRLQKTPTLKFIGRGNRFSDLVGEKLSEEFVRDTLDARLPSSIRYRQLIPIRSPQPAYVLLVDHATEPQSLIQEVESSLRKAHHYNHARALGQLGAITLLVQPHCEAPLADFYRREGFRWGDVKPGYLLPRVADSQLIADLKHSASVFHPDSRHPCPE